MKKLTLHAVQLTLILIFLLSLAACQSNPTTSSAAATDFKTLAKKQQEHDQLLKKHDELLKEWQELKPGLSRLLAIEDELNLLLGQLAQLSTSLEESTANTSHAATMPPVIASQAPATYMAPELEPEAIAAPIIEPAAINTPDIQNVEIANTAAITPAVHETNNAAKDVASANANFALQLASMPEYYRLPVVWKTLLEKNPQLLANMEPNFQKTNVRNTEYYRLKIGSFETRQEANQKCSSLKAAGLDCLVVDYTRSNFEQLVN